jgi:hypothetical protein
LAVCPSILTVFSDVLGLAHVFVVFLWCLRGVPVVFLVVLKERYFLGQNGSHVNIKLASTEMRRFSIGVVWWLILKSLIP